jgi:hypothetical protein
VKLDISLFPHLLDRVTKWIQLLRVIRGDRHNVQSGRSSVGRVDFGQELDYLPGSAT